MNLPTLRFNGNILPHNPHTLKVSYSRDIKKISIPNYGEIYGDYGKNARIVTGDGELCGDNALKSFLKLTELHDNGAVGILTLPEMDPFYAVLSELSLTREPKDGVIGYKFKFIEKTDTPPEEAADEIKSITVIDNDSSLWEISAKYNVGIETLVKNNPSVESPFSVIPAGSEVCL